MEEEQRRSSKLQEWHPSVSGIPGILNQEVLQVFMHARHYDAFVSEQSLLP